MKLFEKLSKKKTLQFPVSIMLSVLLITSCSNNSDHPIKKDEIVYEEKSNDPNDYQKSKEDEIVYQKLTKYLNERNLELCSFSREIENMEIECIHKADALYPDFGIKHNEYVEKLTSAEIKELGQKHNITDSVFTLIAILGLSYCK